MQSRAMKLIQGVSVWEGAEEVQSIIHIKAEKCKNMKHSQDMQLIQKLRDDQKCMKKVFEVMSGRNIVTNSRVTPSWREIVSLTFSEAGVLHIFGPEFLRKPTLTDVERLYAFHENKHGLPGMLESLDCCCIKRLMDMARFFGVSGSNNDINVTQRSPLLNDLKLGKAPEVPFVANDVTYPWGYYLCDGIYPEWVPFVKSVTNLANDDHKRLRYKTMHEAARKDVERTFGVLKKRWAILATPARAYIKEKLANIMYTCIILHNMIIKDRKEAISPK
ncbi:ALP1-like protein [Tanacetum coccineum]